MIIGVLFLKSRIRAQFREEGATSTNPRQKHTVGTIDEDIILRIKGGALESGNVEWTPKWHGLVSPFYNCRGMPTLSDCLSVYSGYCILLHCPLMWRLCLF